MTTEQKNKLREDAFFRIIASKNSRDEHCHCIVDCGEIGVAHVCWRGHKWAVVWFDQLEKLEDFA